MIKKIISALLVCVVAVACFAGCKKQEPEKKKEWSITFMDSGSKVALTEAQNTTLNDTAVQWLDGKTPVTYSAFSEDYVAVININDQTIENTGTTFLVSPRGYVIFNSYVYNQQDNYYQVEPESTLGQVIYSLFGDNSNWVTVSTSPDGTKFYTPAPYVPTPNPDAFTLSPEAQARQDAIDAGETSATTETSVVEGD